jgi:hypothetical protein
MVKSLFLSHGDDGPIYIGRLSKNTVEDRIKILQVGNPIPLKPLLVLDQDRYTLKKIYELFDHLRLDENFDWFVRDEYLTSFIEYLAGKSHGEWGEKKIPKIIYTTAWPKAKVNYLRQNYSRQKRRALCRLLDKSWDTIKMKAKLLGLKRRRNIG